MSTRPVFQGPRRHLNPLNWRRSPGQLASLQRVRRSAGGSPLSVRMAIIARLLPAVPHAPRAALMGAGLEVRYSCKSASKQPGLACKAIGECVEIK